MWRCYSEYYHIMGSLSIISNYIILSLHAQYIIL